MAPRGNTKGVRVQWAASDPLPAPSVPVTYQSAEVHVGLGARPAVDRNALADYVRSVRDVVDQHLDDTWWRTGQDMLLHLELHPGRRTLANLALRPGPSHPALNGLCGRVEALERPAITGPVVLQARFALWGGATL